MTYQFGIEPGWASRVSSAGKDSKSLGLAELGYEAQLWKVADALRNNVDAAESKHVRHTASSGSATSRCHLAETHLSELVKPISIGLFAVPVPLSGRG